MRKLFQNECGTSGIEFALIAPMIATVLMGVTSGWSYFQQDSNMRGSVEVAAKYYIQGGTSDSTALSIAKAAWVNIPPDGSVSVSRSCVCASVSVNCGSGVVCGNGSVPEIHLVIAATSTWKDLFTAGVYPYPLSLKERENVRVR